VQALAGGTVSAATGGDFANGAVSAALQFAFNQLLTDQQYDAIRKTAAREAGYKNLPDDATTQERLGNTANAANNVAAAVSTGVEELYKTEVGLKFAGAALHIGLGSVRYFTPFVRVLKADPAADALAVRLGGTSRVMFPGLFKNREFDAISNLYLGQTKPGGVLMGSALRNQMKATFEASAQVGRTPYFHFDGAPGPGVIQKIMEYQARYKINPVIDTNPF
jgi:hypothetical protein